MNGQHENRDLTNALSYNNYIYFSLYNEFLQRHFTLDLQLLILLAGNWHYQLCLCFLLLCHIVLVLFCSILVLKLTILKKIICHIRVIIFPLGECFNNQITAYIAHEIEGNNPTSKKWHLKKYLAKRDDSKPCIREEKKRSFINAEDELELIVWRSMIPHGWKTVHPA